MNQPRISVVMPVYNRDWCVAQAIDSVLATNAPGLEIVIVDDGSTDGTADILARYAAGARDRIRVVTHPGRVNRGIACSRNLGVGMSRGDYLAFLDSDDLFYPERFRYAIPWLEKHPEAVGCIEPFSREALGTPSSRQVFKHLTEVSDANYGWLRAMLFSTMYWHMSCITLSRERASEYGKFDERLPFAEETALWLRLAASQVLGTAQCAAPVACVRRHATHSWDPSDHVADCRTYLHVLRDVLARSSKRSDDSAATVLIAEKLRRYLIEILSDARLPLSFRVVAWRQALSACPPLASDRRIIANLARAPFRRHSQLPI